MTRYDGCDAACEWRRPVVLAVTSFVRDRDARAGVRADVEPSLELGAVTDLATGQVEVERIAAEIDLEVAFGRKAAARTAKRLAPLPPFAPAVETWERAVVLSKNRTKCAVWLHSARRWKNASNTPERFSRQDRFHTLFHLPYPLGCARHVMLCTVK